MTNVEQQLKEQNELLKAILLQGEKTRKGIIWIKVLGTLRLVIIITPIVLALVYLPPFIGKAIDKYKAIVPGLENIETLIENQK